MGIISYHPKKKVVTDRRSEDGGYYEATCDHCGNTFWPVRSTAKYCSNSCNVAATRNRKLQPVTAANNKVRKPYTRAEIQAELEALESSLGHLSGKDKETAKTRILVLKTRLRNANI